MLLRFTKMHGLGNDFAVLDLVTQCFKVNERLVRRLADRHTGIGFDQLLIVEPPSRPDIDFRYRIFNADGSEVEQCGNGARCFARFVRDKKLIGRDEIFVETAKGRAVLRLVGREVEVDMGAPQLTLAEIPFDLSINGVSASSEGVVRLDRGVVSYTVETQFGTQLITPVSMGNPHGVMVVPSVDRADVERLGPLFESHPIFPERANIGFMEVVNRNQVRLRVYERGAGETQACGTGACAAVVAGILRGLLDPQVTVALPGGELQIEWHGVGTSVMMTGPATTVYEGQVFV